MISSIINWFKSLYNWFLSLLSDRSTFRVVTQGTAPMGVENNPVSLESFVGSQLARVLTKPNTDRVYSPTDQVALFVHPDTRVLIKNFIHKLSIYSNELSEEAQVMIRTKDVDRMAKYLYLSKVPMVFAEKLKVEDHLIYKQNSSWSHEVASLLEGISPVIDCQQYHNGVFDYAGNAYAINFDEPKPVKLLYVAGVCFKGEYGESSEAYKKIVVDGNFQHRAYINEVKRRLLPLIQYIDLTHQGDKKILLKVPGISCGVFAGDFKNGQVQKGLFMAIKEILSENVFQNIGACVLDVYKKNTLLNNEEGKHSEQINGIDFIAYESQVYNQGKIPQQQIHIGSDASVYDEKFSDYESCCFVAGDHFSLPGNDYYRGSPTTNDGNWANATDLVAQVIGVEQIFVPGLGMLVNTDFNAGQFAAPGVISEVMPSAVCQLSPGAD